MKNIIKINDEISIKESRTINKTKIYIIKNNEQILLTNIKTNDYFWCKCAYDENYIVVYSRGCMVNQIPLNIESAYDIKNDKFINLKSKNIKTILEYMFISKKSFDLAVILSVINFVDSNMATPQEIDNFIKYLTFGNKKINLNDIKLYILNCYPSLKEYTNLKFPISIFKYRKLLDEIERDTFWFHIMPQNLDYIESLDLNNQDTNYAQIDISEYENTQKVLQKTKNSKLIRKVK